MNPFILITNRTIAILFCIALFLMACEKEYKVNLPSTPPELVVEGYIENGALPYVFLTRSVGFFDKIDFNAIKFQDSAVASVTDLTTNIKVDLFNYIIDTSFNNQKFKFIVYAPKFNDPNLEAIRGKMEHLYRLDIESRGKLYTATTKVVNTVLADSVWFEKFDLANPDSALSFHLRYRDPDTLGNFNRYETQVKRQYKKQGLDENFLTSFSSVFDDKFTNGKQLPFKLTLGSSKGINFRDSAQRANFEAQTRVYPGDTVTLKWSGIDFDTYNFWETLEFSRNSVGNPFSSPTKVKSNIKGGIGIWAGYGTRYITAIAPK
jgi:Domain of unknown function (DUF4249)